MGPDGNLWFTEQVGKIGRITPAGVITEFSVPTANSGPDGITAGPDGNLWFTEGEAGKIGRIATGGVITEFTIPTANSRPDSITTGPDGNLWFTETAPAANRIGRITTAGVVTEFPIPSADAEPTGITAGPDGALWFTELGGIGRITTSGTFSPTSPFLVSNGPVSIVTGPDGNLWFAEELAMKVGRITPSGTVTTFATTRFPNAITTGPDGNLWFTEGSQVAEITPSGSLTEFPFPGDENDPVGITTGPADTVWIAEHGANSIGEVVLGAPVTAPDLALSGSAPTSASAGSQLSYSFTVTNNGTAGATGVTLTDTLPAGVTFNSATGGVTPVSGVLTFNIGSLAAGASANITIVVTPTAAATLNNGAVASMTQTDPTPADNSVTLTTAVASQAAPDLALSGTAPGSGTVGTKLTYTLTVTNNGTAEATSVKLTGALTGAATFVSATGGVKPVNGVLTFLLGNLAAGAHTTVTIVVTPTAAGQLTDSAMVSMDQTDPTPADNSVMSTTQVMSVHRMGFHNQPTTLVLKFGEPLDPAWAQNPDDYRLVALAGSHRAIRMKSALYNAATQTVTLRPVHRLNLHRLFRLTVEGPGTSGLTGFSGHLPDSANTAGDPPSNSVTIISAADLVLTTKNPAILRKYHKILLEQSAELKRLQTP
jgi:virginiamycin B lyase